VPGIVFCRGCGGEPGRELAAATGRGGRPGRPVAAGVGAARLEHRPAGGVVVSAGVPLIDGAADEPGVTGGLAAGSSARPGGSGDETARWLAALGGTGTTREQALARLHGLLLRVARAELGRRAGRHPITGPELDDLAHQSADDALLAVTTKLAQFRGDSRFTTWAYKFVVLEVSSKLGRHFWQRPSAALDAADWDRLPDRVGTSPADQAERHDLIAAVRRAVEEKLTERQRRVFIAIAVDGVPLDALVVELGSSRNAIYKTMFDARRKVRAALAANGYLAGSAEEAGLSSRSTRRS
jgi:RNA polymerase sigma-70 factor, ECF subfamily